MDNLELEIPLGKRTKAYRFFEMLPAILSYGMVLALVVISFFSPLLGSIYLLILIITLLVRAIGVANHSIRGQRLLSKSQSIDYCRRLAQLEDVKRIVASLDYQIDKGEFRVDDHIANLKRIAVDPESYPKPSSILNAVIIAIYNESYEVLRPTLESIKNTTYNNKQIVVILAYEERGGDSTKEVVGRLLEEYKTVFRVILSSEHPANLPDEVVGKGANITFAGFYLKDWLDTQKISYKDVIVTTLDSDNKPHPAYFDSVTYEYIVREDRKRCSYQPVSLFFNNIWDVPAPMRVVATGNSFWNIIVMMRPHLIRNFASHSQPMDALVEMSFWSKRTIVEDGHQYWRSYFYFKGDYIVVPINVPIYQDAVLSDSYLKTLKAQFIQLRRWAYGASDVPYVATRVLTRKCEVPFWAGFTRLVRLLDSHVTLASLAILVAFGGWVPLLVNQDAARDIAAHQLPVIVSKIQTIAMLGLFITIYLSVRLLPPRPARLKWYRSLFMLTQWILMPITSIVYSSMSAFNAQTHLMLGKYLDKFDVTDKVAVYSSEYSEQINERN